MRRLFILMLAMAAVLPAAAASVVPDVEGVPLKGSPEKVARALKKKGFESRTFPWGGAVITRSSYGEESVRIEAFPDAKGRTDSVSVLLRSPEVWREVERIFDATAEHYRGTLGTPVEVSRSYGEGSPSDASKLIRLATGKVDYHTLWLCGEWRVLVRIAQEDYAPCVRVSLSRREAAGVKAPAKAAKKVKEGKTPRRKKEPNPRPEKVTKEKPAPKEGKAAQPRSRHAAPAALSEDKDKPEEVKTSLPPEKVAVPDTAAAFGRNATIPVTDSTSSVHILPGDADDAFFNLASPPKTSENTGNNGNSNNSNNNNNKKKTVSR